MKWFVFFSSKHLLFIIFLNLVIREDIPIFLLEEKLAPNLFFRVNRQMIVNIDAVECAIPQFKGRIKIIRIVAIQRGQGRLPTAHFLLCH